MWKKKKGETSRSYLRRSSNIYQPEWYSHTFCPLVTITLYFTTSIIKNLESQTLAGETLIAARSTSLLQLSQTLHFNRNHLKHL